LIPQDSSSAVSGVDIDRQLVRAVANGSADALGRLYNRYAPTVFGLARRILTRPEDAEEVVQDVFAQVWRDAGRYAEDRATVAGWIVMLARTRAIDRLRARHARPDQPQGVESSTAAALVAGGSSPEQAASAAEESRAVKRALGELPESQRSLVELGYYEGLTHTEIAARTGVPLGTVKTRLRLAMTTLRDALKDNRGTGIS
jgi:RNA polymerase sigma-70 factor, ECF subfamily